MTDKKVQELIEMREDSERLKATFIHDAREEGKKAGQIEIAKIMLSNGISKEDILKYTGIEL